VERPPDVDEIAPRRAFYCSSHVDFFEEVAKLRAARRMWAKLMRDRFGAKDPRSLQFRFGCIRPSASAASFPREHPLTSFAPQSTNWQPSAPSEVPAPVHR
jgi:methylmalonyl-CoA mutase N-terminal domain/subunit